MNKEPFLSSFQFCRHRFHKNWITYITRTFDHRRKQLIVTANKSYAETKIIDVRHFLLFMTHILSEQKLVI